MKKVISLILVFTLLCSAALFSCSSADDKENTTEEGGAPEAPETVSLTVAGKNLSEFTIIYAKAEYAKQGPKNFTTEWDFYKLTAKDIQAKLYALTGIALEVKQDEKSEEGASEILVGPTNRVQSTVYDSMDVYSYANKVDSGKLVIGGGYNATYLNGGLKEAYAWASTYHSFDEIYSYIESERLSGKAEIELAEGFEKSGTLDIPTIACIGDSITEGYASSDWKIRSYPAVMQRVLWKDYIVVNYGKSATTMRNDLTEKKYQGSAQHKAAKKYSKHFDGVLIMLGINDGGVDNVEFTKEEDKSFNDSALMLVESIANGKKELKVGILNATAYYGTNPGTREHVRVLQKQLVGIIENEGYDAQFVNMYNFTTKQLKKSNFPDGIHPDDAGYAAMGEYLAGVGVAILNEKWDDAKQKINE